MQTNTFNRNRFRRGFRTPQGYGRSRFPKKNAAQIDTRAYVRKASPMAPEAPFVPVHQFRDFPLHETILKNIESHGYKNPTPIQDSAILPICEGKDVVAIANTGTGKTATFLLPTLTKILKNRTERALILTPTRELALQIEAELKIFASHTGIRSLIVMGGSNIMTQIRVLKTNPSVVIATPGRLKDLINRKAINLSTFKTVVLDEVDRMVDIGFLPDVKFIVGHLSSPRQSLFFSATIDDSVRSVLSNFTHNPENISVKKTETALSIDQDIVRVEHPKKKLEKLIELSENREFTKILVFVRTKRGADHLAKELTYERFRVAAIHGNKKQGARTRALSDFKTSKVQLLVATDVAARGIDIPNVNLVINYDEPATYEDYVHRIGRTGRGGNTGKALTFVVGNK